ncbi:unnamed protein product, partial [Ixodes pacificus]
VWRCRKNRDWKKSIITGTFFENCHLPLGQVVEVLFVVTGGGAAMSSVQRIASRETRTLSRHTIVGWTWYLRDTCFRWFDEVQSLPARPSIGRPEKSSRSTRPRLAIVSIIEDEWSTVFGFLEWWNSRQGLQAIVCEDNKRDKAELLKLIKRHVLPGTTIMTDEWKAYSSLPQLGFQHLTVNHSLYFVDPATWANTQTIESTWRSLKRHHAHSGGTRHSGYGLHLCEFMWRREMAIRDMDPFLGFLETAAAVYP